MGIDRKRYPIFMHYDVGPDDYRRVPADADTPRPETVLGPGGDAAAIERIESYCREEVERQGHDTSVEDGRVRLAWMIAAYTAAWTRAARGEPIWVGTIIEIGKGVERVRNRDGIRTGAVQIADEVRSQSKTEITDELRELVGFDTMDALEWYLRFERIHPFIDGNGRTGKILLTWLTNRWTDPKFPPNDIFGYPITNP